MMSKILTYWVRFLNEAIRLAAKLEAEPNIHATAIKRFFFINKYPPISLGRTTQNRVLKVRKRILGLLSLD